MSLIVLSQTVILILYMLIGVILLKRNLFTSQVEQCFGWLLTNIALPLAILSGFQIEYSPEIVKLIRDSLFVSFAIVLSTMGLGFIFTVVFRKTEIERRLWVACFTFSNILFIGIPIVSQLIGPKGLLVLVVYNTVANIVLFTIGIMIFSGSNKFNAIRIIKTPAILAALLGFCLFWFQISVPNTILTFITSIGNMTTPLSMIVNGAIIARLKVVRIFINRDNILFSILRLVVLPLCLIPIIKEFIDDPVILVIMSLVIGMPTGALNSVFAEQYAGQGAKVSQYIIISTLLSMITLPLIMIFY